MHGDIPLHRSFVILVEGTAMQSVPVLPEHESLVLAHAPSTGHAGTLGQGLSRRLSGSSIRFGIFRAR